MNEYIDRDLTEKALMERCNETGYGGLNRTDVKMVMRTPWRIPNADVVPRKDYESMERTVDKLNKSLFFLSTIKRNRAKWIYNDMSRRICSNCGNPVAFKLIDGNWYEGDFCPNCGARMEES